MKRSVLRFALPVLVAAGAASATAAELTPPASGVTASTSDTNVAANTVDNNLASRWSGNGTGAWIQFDLGATRLVQSVGIAVYQGNARRNRFDLLYSTGNGTWNNLLLNQETSGTTTAEQSWDVPDVEARLIRYVGKGATITSTGANSSWNSLTEVSIFGTTGGTPTPITPTPVTPTPSPTPTPGATNHARNKPATASSIEGAGLEPARAVDGSATTRWASAAGVDPQWLQIDLGNGSNLNAIQINRVVLRWEAAFASAYRVEVSSNGSGWTTIHTATGADGGVDDLAIGGTGRFIRIFGTQRGTQWGYSLFEVEVYGTPVPNQPTPTPITPTPVTPTPTPRATPTPTPRVTPTPTPVGGSPVALNGQLRVCGTKLCNRIGQPIQLRGMSTHGIQWYPQCIDNNAAMDALVNDWRADVLRVSMYVQEGGYETDPPGFTELAEGIIDRAIARGIYVVIDWHMLTPGDPMVNLGLARQYFTHMAQRYGNTPNVIYEIANEPHGVSWSRIRDYAHQIIPTIRNIDPDGVILVGTRAWSSLGISEGGNASEVINNPVNASNIMYVFHMYAASHGTGNLNALSNAANSIPMFVTEWGTQQASGDGPNNFNMSQQYVDMMRNKQISWINWNWSDDMRSGAVFTTGTCPSGPYAGTSRLKPAGVWIRERILNPPDNFPTN